MLGQHLPSFGGDLDMPWSSTSIKSTLDTIPFSVEEAVSGTLLQLGHSAVETADLVPKSPIHISGAVQAALEKLCFSI